MFTLPDKFLGDLSRFYGGSLRWAWESIVYSDGRTFNSASPNRPT